ncbi:MAG: transporter associated domain-containing protein [Candidatus Eisenbacteria bacterium]
MSPIQPIAILVWVVSALVVWLLGWETTTGNEERRSRLHRAIEVHLGLWAFFGLAVVLKSAFWRTAPPWTAALTTLALGPVAALLLELGRRREGTPFPRGGLWVLAPLRGISLWLLLGFEALRARIRRAEPTPSHDMRSEEPTSPVSLLEAVRELDSLTLEEIMVPRSQVMALSGEETPRDALARVRGAKHSTYPVHAESVDHILGLVRMVDLAKPGQIDRPVSELAATAPIYPETMRGLDLLSEIGNSEVKAALVVDEFGSPAGLVTAEDLFEVLIGDLVGEHEVVKRRILPVEPGVYRVDGACEIEEFNDEVREVLPEGDYETVAGLILEYTGRIPQSGDEVDLGRAVLEVEEATDRRILWVQVTLTDVKGGPSPQASSG